MTYVNFVIERSFFNGKGTLETDRNTMEKDRATVADTQKIQARRTSLDRQPQSLRRDFVDPTHRSTMGGFAQEVSQPFNVLAATEALGRTRRLA